VNEQEMFSRVGELSGRIGYPMPSIKWVEGVTGQACALLRENRQGAATLVLHDHIEAELSREEQDFHIAQELVQARQGAHRHRRRIKAAVNLVSGVAGLFGVLGAGQLVEPLWLASVLGLVIACSTGMICHLAVAFVWSRWFVRRSDRALIELLGRQQVVSLLQGYAAHPRPTDVRWRLRWLQRGAPPYAPQRLRMLGEALTVA
jgi:hypothetical protein